MHAVNNGARTPGVALSSRRLEKRGAGGEVDGPNT